MIRKLLQMLFGWPCEHQWELIGRYEVRRKWTTGREYNGVQHDYRCTKCCAFRKHVA